MNKSMMKEEVTKHLTENIIPFWKALRDDTYGGYYGYMDYNLNVDKTAEKGCILNSRITWFFANAYILLKDETLLDEARHGYEFLRDHCIDKENGGIFWSMTYDGKPLDTTKHTYNQAFCIYALSSYYDASGDEEALKLAKELQLLIESKCTDEVGYLEAFTKDFQPESNEKLSENGVQNENGSLDVTILDGRKAKFVPKEHLDLLRWFAERDKNEADEAARHKEKMQDKKAVEKSNKDEVFKYHIARVNEDDYLMPGIRWCHHIDLSINQLCTFTIRKSVDVIYCINPFFG